MAENKNEWPYVAGVEYVTGATVWAYDGGDAKVVPWKRMFGHIQAGRLGCVPAPEKGWNRYVEGE